jgi:hypothetical protein
MVGIDILDDGLIAGVAKGVETIFGVGVGMVILGEGVGEKVGIPELSLVGEGGGAVVVVDGSRGSN